MNTEQLSTWKEIVQQCQSRSFSSINVASQVRSDAIIAADELVGLVTLELADLLERLYRCTLSSTFGDPYASRQCMRDRETAHVLAARIQEALEGE